MRREAGDAQSRWCRGRCARYPRGSRDASVGVGAAQVSDYAPREAVINYRHSAMTYLKVVVLVCSRKEAPHPAHISVAFALHLCGNTHR